LGKTVDFVTERDGKTTYCSRKTKGKQWAAKGKQGESRGKQGLQRGKQYLGSLKYVGKTDMAGESNLPE
jgi:hypothetical protein